MQISRGKIRSAQKVVVYGPEGIGKSTLAAKFPDPLFIDTEGSTKHMDVSRTPKPTSWTMLLDQVRYVRQHPSTCGTLVIDTADWAEQLAIADVCATAKKTSIEDFGYGKGYVYISEAFGKLLNLLDEVIETGTNVVFTAHAKMRKFEQPDEMGAYDRWEMKLGKNTAPLVKEWADMVLFANYKTHVINVDNQGAVKGKNKAQGGERVLHACHHPCWDAKNRHNLPDELPMDYAAFAHCIPTFADPPPIAPMSQPKPKSTPPRQPVETAPEQASLFEPDKTAPPPPTPTVAEKKTASTPEGIPKALFDLMWQYSVTEDEVQEVVASRGYYPRGMPIQDYDSGFIDGVLIAAWPQVFGMIEATRANPDKKDTPF